MSSPSPTYTCPMHPEIVRDAPGDCPICGMALELRGSGESDDAELRDMTRRLIWSAALTLPVVALAMAHMLPGKPLEAVLPHRVGAWFEGALATPVVLWSGWRSIVNRSLNMFSLIALGVGVAYAFTQQSLIWATDGARKNERTSDGVRLMRSSCSSIFVRSVSPARNGRRAAPVRLT